MEADEQFDDHDSTFGGDRQSLAPSTSSLQSAITNYSFENGRRYHAYKEGSYNFPNDEREIARMDIEHINQKLQTNGHLHACPWPEHAEEVLDLGTGQGVWAIEMADLHPDCQITGTDLSPIQPDWVPPNCRFEIDDFNEDWTWGDNRFDMIHCRLLIGSVSSYSHLYKQAYAALKPGGYIELSDTETMLYSHDGTVKDDMAVIKWSKLWDEAVEKVGKRIPKAEEYPEMIKDAGFTDIHFSEIPRPTNDWPRDPVMKDIGYLTNLNYMEGLEAFTMALFTRIHEWKPEEVQLLMSQIRSEWRNRKIHGWQKGIRLYARKPQESQ